MKNLISMLLVVFFVNALQAQTTFLVTDGEGIPVSDIDVIINKKSIGKTDKEGMIKAIDIKKNDSVVFKSNENYIDYFYVAPKNNPMELQEIELEMISIEDRLDLDFNVVAPDHEHILHEDKIYDLPEVPACFPGGLEKMNLYLSKMIQKLAINSEERTFSRCYVKMVVEKNGMLSNCQIIRGVPNCPECDKEALSLVKSMPNWNPAINNGRAVRSYFVVPVTFE